MTNFILTAIYKAIWGVFISGPLYLISGFNDILYYLSGGVIYDLLFGGKKEFTWSNIPTAFWGFCILATAIVVIIFLVQFITLHFSEHKEIKHKIVHAVKMTGFACVFVFFIPIRFFCLNQLIVFLQGTLSQVFEYLVLIILILLVWCEILVTPIEMGKMFIAVISLLYQVIF